MVSSILTCNDYHIYLLLVALSFGLHYCLVLPWIGIWSPLILCINQGSFILINSTKKPKQ